MPAEEESQRLVHSDNMQQGDTHSSPGSLSACSTECLPGAGCGRVVCESHVTLEAQDAGGRDGSGRLAKVRVVELAGSGVLRSGSPGVDESLDRHRVGTGEGDELGGREGLGAEEGQQVRSALLHIGKQTLRREVEGVLATHERGDARATGADDGGDVGANLDKVRSGDTVLLVGVEPDLGLAGDGLQTVVLPPVELPGVEDGPVGTTERKRRVPGGGVVEAEPDGAAGESRTLVAVGESAHHVGNDVAPDAALVGAALGRPLRAGRCVDGSVAGSLAAQDGMDGHCLPLRHLLCPLHYLSHDLAHAGASIGGESGERHGKNCSGPHHYGSRNEETQKEKGK